MTDIHPEIKERTPRFLFRGWYSGSGGHSDLNTPEKINTLYFKKHPRNRVRSLLDRDDVQKLVDPHINQYSKKGFESEFSSWTNCFGVALSFIKDRGSGHVSFIDRNLLERDVEFFNVADLAMKDYATHVYAYEWIAHGPISGPGLFCVSVEELMAAGIIRDDGCGCGYNDKNKGHRFRLNTETNNVSVEKAVAEGIQLARLQLKLEPAGAILPELAPACYVLILIWIAIQSDPNIAIEGFKGAAAIVQEIYTRLSLDVPNELEAAFQDQYTPDIKSHCERTRCIVKGIVETRRNIKNSLFDPAIYVEGSKVVENFKAEVDKRRELPLLKRSKRLALPTGPEVKPMAQTDSSM